LVSTLTKTEPGSLLATLLDTGIPLPPDKRAQELENSEELEAAYKSAALQGDSEVPTNAEDEVDYHFICFARSSRTGLVYELDGDRKGPVTTSICLQAEKDILCEGVVKLVKGLMEREQSDAFGLMALVRSEA
jgi:ubiquitin carboxyl-terminal hydrolase L3